jgi:hypothetical protein
MCGWNGCHIPSVIYVTIQHGFNGVCCECNCLEYSNIDLIYIARSIPYIYIYMEYFWQEQALNLLFMLVNVSLMLLDCVQMNIGSKT